MKKRKLKRKVKYSIVLLLLILTLGVINNNSVYSKLKRLNYSKSAINEIKKNNIEKEVLNNNYSKTLEVALTSKNFYKDNLNIYLSVENIDNKEQIKNINTLVTLDYDKSDIEKIYKKLDNEQIEYLTNYTYIDNLKSYLDYEIFKPDRLERYINYKSENTDLTYKEIILNVNMDLDKEFYEEPNIIKNPDDMLVLVNKYNKLPDDYEAKDLVQIDSKYTVSKMLLNKEAKEKFEEMCTDAKSINLIIKGISAYRTKEYQKGLYNDYIKNNGFEMAESFSARPRHSEHETGLAIDVASGTNGYTTFENTEEYKWIKQNAQNYGFIVRYKKEYEHITGYKFEAWHLRYVGKDISKYIYEHNITFEEYYAMFLDK